MIRVDGEKNEDDEEDDEEAGGDGRSRYTGKSGGMVAEREVRDGQRLEEQEEEEEPDLGALLIGFMTMLGSLDVTHRCIRETGFFRPKPAGWMTSHELIESGLRLHTGAPGGVGARKMPVGAPRLGLADPLYPERNLAVGSHRIRAVLAALATAGGSLRRAGPTDARLHTVLDVSAVLADRPSGDEAVAAAELAAAADGDDGDGWPGSGGGGRGASGAGRGRGGGGGGVHVTGGGRGGANNNFHPGIDDGHHSFPPLPVADHKDRHNRLGAWHTPPATGRPVSSDARATAHQEEAPHTRGEEQVHENEACHGPSDISSYISRLRIPVPPSYLEVSRQVVSAPPQQTQGKQEEAQKVEDCSWPLLVPAIHQIEYLPWRTRPPLPPMPPPRPPPLPPTEPPAASVISAPSDPRIAFRVTPKS